MPKSTLSITFAALVCLFASRANALPADACHVRSTPLTAAETALAQDDENKAVELFKAEAEAKTEGSDAAREGWVHSLLYAGKVAEAEEVARPWANEAAKNIWAQIAWAEVQYRKGEIPESFVTMQVALKLDACNPRIWYLLSRYFALNGFYAKSKRSIDTAHALDPIDDRITSRWISEQPKAVMLAELTRYLERTSFLTEKQRASLEKWKKHLETREDGSCRLAAPVESAKIPLRLIQDDVNSSTLWVLDTTINGRKERLEIDTGASGFVLTHIAAEGLDLHPTATFKSGGFGDEGAVDTYVAKAKSIRIGGLEFVNCDVQVLGNSRHTAEGLIGGDVFETFLLTLDFPGRVLKLDPLPAYPGETAQNTKGNLGIRDPDAPPRDRYIDPSMSNWTQVYRSGHDLIFPVRLNNGPIRLFEIDSGSSLNLISPNAAKEVTKVASGATVELTGISGKVNRLATSDAITMDFAGLRQPTTGMITTDLQKMSNASGIELSGFLGAQTLRQLVVTIDYRDNLVHFTFDPKHQRNCVADNSLLDCF